MKPLVIPEFFSDKVSHGFFGRKGGVSSSVFESLNVTPYSGDDVELVRQNREIVRAQQKAKRLVTLKQTHSDLCLVASNILENESVVEGDALVTDQKGLALGVMTADCAPVLFEGKKPDGQTVIGAAHAGWGGAFRGICESTLDKMEELGCLRETIKSALRRQVMKLDRILSVRFWKKMHLPRGFSWKKAITYTSTSSLMLPIV